MRTVEEDPLVGVHRIQGGVVGDVAAQIFLCLLQKCDFLRAHFFKVLYQFLAGGEFPGRL